MIRAVVLAALVAAVGTTGSALSSGGIAGIYTTTINSTAEGGILSGVWRITLNGGKTVAQEQGTTVVTGRYAVSGTTITFSHESGQDACPASSQGVYHWSLKGSLLTLKAVKDTCQGRKIVFSSHALHKIH